MGGPGATSDPLAGILAGERARLVGLCAHLIGDRTVAEDLAQEALVEAWRNRHKLTDPAGAAPWLSAIARNVCLRYRSRLGREAIRASSLPADLGDAGEHGPDGSLAAAFDVEIDLEHRDLAALLDRALALLPPQTRAALIAHYIEGSPLAEIAAQLGVAEGAVKMRLRRGTLALRQVLTGELRDEAIAHGLVAPTDGAWQETRIWCPLCGQRRLLGRLRPDEGEFTLTCADCAPLYGVRHAHPLNPAWFRQVFGGVAGYRPALTRLMRWVDARYRPALAVGIIECEGCGRPAPLWHHPPPEYAAILPSLRGVHARCDHCQLMTDVRLSNLALYLPEVRRFWRDHPRLRTLPERAVEAGGRPALVLGFASATGNARLDVVLARDTYETLAIHRHADA